VSVDFALCPDPRHDAAIRRVVQGCVEFLGERLRDDLVALVLTGSFSRGEGSVLGLDGRLRVLGDIEFLVILPHESDYRTRRRQMAAWGREASATLGGGDVRVDIEFGPVEVDYLRKRARPSIFVYDLATYGKVVWGPPDLLEAIPAFGPEHIPREDAVHLIFNRTIEQLDAWEALDTLDAERLLDVGYQRLKLVLDLAGSALAFDGQHATSYAQRPAAFAALLAREPDLARLLPSTFASDLLHAARAKLAPVADGFPSLAQASVAEQCARLRAQMLDVVPVLAGFLRWELERVLGARGPLTDLLGRYLRAPRLGRRVWDWAKVALHPLPAPLPLSAPRSARLFCRSTPRALLYTAGVLAYLNLVDDRRAPDTISRLLPLPGAAMPRTAAEQRRAIVALWRWCVRNN
jgi:hypothetical protein